MAGSPDSVLVRSGFAAFLLALAGSLGMVHPAQSQLISPGKLSRAHSSLEGISNCTQCHKLRVPGADRTRCLACHGALEARIEAEAGFHGSMEEEDCGTCHKEHLGLDFDLLRLDPDTFAHALTGYPLEGAHQAVACRDCHYAERIVDPLVIEEGSRFSHLDRTYLGLDAECRTCHADVDPHGDQFAERSCSTCHGSQAWEDADLFDHDLTDFPLEGGHRSLECSSCHVTEQDRAGPEVIRYAPTEHTRCASCHADPHQGQMAGNCESCHVPAAWTLLIASGVDRGFDHGSTSFPLVGAHERANCRACHTPRPRGDDQIRLVFPEGTGDRAYPTPEHALCTSCHLDAHDGVFEDPSCNACHTQEGWSPPDYSRAQHRMSERFELTGAHVVTPCSACHETGESTDRSLIFRFENPTDCRVCHVADDPHDGGFGVVACAECHQTSSFNMETFEHDRLGEAGWTGACGTCHASDDPHGDQFGDRDCAACHATESYAVDSFDHSQTRFPLEGAHAEAGCVACHVPEIGSDGLTMIRYRPLPLECSDCHGGGR